jgi:hypothetical protein
LLQSRQTREFFLVNVPQRLLRDHRTRNFGFKLLQVLCGSNPSLVPGKDPHLTITAPHDDIAVWLRTTRPDGNSGESNRLNTLAVLPDLDAPIFASRHDFAGGEDSEGVDEVGMGMELEQLFPASGPDVNDPEISFEEVRLRVRIVSGAGEA